MTKDHWQHLGVPDGWTASAMLKNVVLDHIGPDRVFESIDDATRERILGFTALAVVELAGKLATLGNFLLADQPDEVKRAFLGDAEEDL